MSESNATELLPCPFCGGKADHHDIGNEHTKSRSTKIWCTGCHFTKNVAATRQGLDWTRAEAIASWNRRAVSAPAVAPEVREALEGMVRVYVALVDSGDAGFWDPEEVAEVKAARSALAHSADASGGGGDQLAKVRQAVAVYHLALDNREHGGIAAHYLVEAVQQALGMPWRQGVEKAKRSAPPAQQEG